MQHKLESLKQKLSSDGVDISELKVSNIWHAVRVCCLFGRQQIHGEVIVERVLDQHCHGRDSLDVF